MTRLTKCIQWGLLALVALMPLHAFLSVWLGHIVGHEAVIQSWKEVLLVILALGVLVLLWREPGRWQRLRQPWVLAAAALILLGMVVTALSHPKLLVVAFGAKTDFEFLIAGFVAALAAGGRFLRRLQLVIIAGAAVVAGFDVLQIFVLPPDFLTHFGYGPATILPYQHIASGSSFLRFPSTLGGPNQLGTYLILPLCLATALAIKRRQPWYLALLGAGIITLIWTFSRSAWIGAVVALVLTVAAVLPAKWRRPASLTAAALGVILVAALAVAVQRGGQLQYFILHSSVAAHSQAAQSDSQHALSLGNGLREVLAAPLGHGLGTAGPTTFHVGAVNIIEDYYLQLGYELGLLAILLFVVCIGLLIWKLIKLAAASPLALATGAAFIGVSIVAIVLPAWVDSTTALVMWITAGGLTGSADV